MVHEYQYERSVVRAPILLEPLWLRRMAHEASSITALAGVSRISRTRSYFEVSAVLEDNSKLL